MAERELVAVGVDAGGTATTVAVSHGGAFRREVDGPGANATTLGVDDAADAIVRSVRHALGEHERAAAVVVGAAGAGRAELARTLEELVASAFGDARVVVGDDAAIALRAALPAGPGAVVISGTGSVAYAENGDRRIRVGGLGHRVGDEGSGFAIGMAAVRHYGRVLDGRARRDETAELVARAFDAHDRDAYLSAMYDQPIVPARFAALAPAIVAFAGKGNVVAKRIVQEASQDLGNLVKSAVTQAGLLDASPSVVLAGGLLRENNLLTFLLETRVVGDVPGAHVIRGGDGAARGALRLAESLLAP
jgi:N-acetylglucosamine kinase-like BadF-type ATPase